MNGDRWQQGYAPHVPPPVTVGGVMRAVLYALAPGIAAHAYFFGPGIVFQIALACVFAIAFEALMLGLRRRSIGRGLGDGSAIVTAVLFALCLPPLAPWWLALVGMLFAMVFAKHLYGGIGQNVFNPAMVGYVVVLISFPRAMTRWTAPAWGSDTAPSWAETTAAIFASPAVVGRWDALTSATPLDAWRSAVQFGNPTVFAAEPAVLGPWAWLAGAFALGGAWLLWRRVISWHVPAGMLGAIAAASLAAAFLAPAESPGPAFHLFAGAAVLGAFFIATDPVSGCTTPAGRLWFGIGAGFLTWAIRRWGAYPDGVAFAVLLMNMAAPLIDRLTRPRIYGH